MTMIRMKPNFDDDIVDATDIDEPIRVDDGEDDDFFSRANVDEPIRASDGEGDQPVALEGVESESQNRKSEEEKKEEIQDFVTESLDVTTDAESQIKKIQKEVLNQTGIKISDDDPVMTFLLHQYSIHDKLSQSLSESAEQAAIISQNALAQQQTNLIEELKKEIQQFQDSVQLEQAKLGDEFDNRLNELKQILSIMENAKQAIVNDVWEKLNKRVVTEIKDQLSQDLKQIAQNENNQVNRQKNLLLGSLAGLLLGLIIGVALAFIK